MEVLERRLAKQKRASYNNKDIAKECDLLERLKAFLEEGNLAKNFECQDEDEEAFLKEYNLLTAKPVIFAANVSEDDLANDGADNEYVEDFSRILQLHISRVTSFIIGINIKSRYKQSPPGSDIDHNPAGFLYCCV